MIDTRQKILDAAERLFAEQGYGSTSLRQIIAGAGVNLASIHYHFGSKERLLDEVILRKAGPVNEERLARLTRAEVAANGRAVPLREVLEAFLLPMAEQADGNPMFVLMMGRIIAEGLMPSILQKHFQEVITRVIGALRRSLPDLPQEEFQWRVHFMIGAMAHTMCGPIDYSGAGSKPVDFSARVERLVSFLCGGFSAPVEENK